MTDTPPPLVPRLPLLFEKPPVYLSLPELQQLIESTSATSYHRSLRPDISIRWSNGATVTTDTVFNLGGLTKLGKVETVERTVRYEDGSTVVITINNGGIVCRTQEGAGNSKADDAVNRTMQTFEAINPAPTERARFSGWIFIPGTILSFIGATGAYLVSNDLSIIEALVGFALLCSILIGIDEGIAWLVDQWRKRNAQPWLSHERYSPKRLTGWQVTTRISLVVGIVVGLLTIAEVIL